MFNPKQSSVTLKMSNFQYFAEKLLAVCTVERKDTLQNMSSKNSTFWLIEDDIQWVMSHVTVADKSALSSGLRDKEFYLQSWRGRTVGQHSQSPSRSQCRLGYHIAALHESFLWKGGCFYVTVWGSYISNGHVFGRCKRLPVTMGKVANCYSVRGMHGTVKDSCFFGIRELLFTM